MTSSAEIEKFHQHVVRLFNLEVGQRFLEESSGLTDFSYAAASAALDRALSIGEPLRPAMGRTGSPYTALIVPPVIQDIAKKVGSGVNPAANSAPRE